MKASKILLILLFTSLNFLTFSQSNILNAISDKTWFEENGFAGESILIYKTQNGLIKAIKQIQGSGFPVIKSEIFDVEINSDTILLKNGLDLLTSEKVKDQTYRFSIELMELTRNENTIKVFGDEIDLYDWTEKNSLAKVKLEYLKKVSIDENEIYATDEIEKLIIEK